MPRFLRGSADVLAVTLHGLRSNRTRSILTVLGVTIGVAPVLLIAGIVAGVRSTVVAELAAAGPDNFVVAREDISALGLGEEGNGSSKRRPPITIQEVELIASLPAVRSATPSVPAATELRHGDRTVAELDVEGVGREWLDSRGGDLASGRNFLPGEVVRAANVAILSAALARELTQGADPVGEVVWVGGLPFRVVGVVSDTVGNLLQPSSQWAVVPYTSAIKYLSADAEWMEIQVVPERGVSRAIAEDAVVTALRASRKLRTGQEENFTLIRQEEVREMFDRLTGMFLGVTVLLSVAGLVVGGIGVIAIMTISVTERTREIGVRKALGATRRQILHQFLLEAVGLTVAGAAAGIVLAGGGAVLLDQLTPIPMSVPVWSVAAALAVAACCGIGFGIYPAGQAARLDPVEALRHE